MSILDFSKDVQLAWAAGFIDGEGCFHIRGAKYRGGIRLWVAQSEVEPLELLQAISNNLGTIYGPYKPSGSQRKPTYSWRLNVAQTKIFLPFIWPFMAEPKKKQVQEFIRLNSRRDIIKL